MKLLLRTLIALSIFLSGYLHAALCDAGAGDAQDLKTVPPLSVCDIDASFKTGRLIQGFLKNIANPA